MNGNENPVLEALTQPATDGTINPGAASVSGNADVRSAITGASSAAVAEHNATAEQPKGKRGRPRKIPLAGLDDGTGQVLPGQGSAENPIEACDDATAKAIAEGALDFCQEIAGVIQYDTAMDCYQGDKLKAQDAKASARFDPEVYQKMVRPGTMLVKKYFAAVVSKWGIEAAFGVPFAAWVIGQIKNNVGMKNDKKERLKAQGQL